MPYVPPAGHNVALRFRGGVYTPPAGNAVPVPFGVLSGSSLTAQGQGSAAAGAFYPAISGSGSSQQSQTAGGALYFLPPARRFLFAQAGARYRRGAPLDESVDLRFGPGDAADPNVALRWDRAERIDVDVDIAWERSSRSDADAGAAWALAKRADAAERLRWTNTLPAAAERRLPMPQAAPADDMPTRARWRNATPRDRESVARWARARGLDLDVWLACDRAVALARQSRLPWGMARAPDWIYIIRPPPPPPPPPPAACYTPPAGNRVPLRFRGAYVPPAGNAVPVPFSCRVERRFDIRRTLTVSHSLSVVRLPDRLPLRVRSFSAAADRDSWNWTVQLTLANPSSLIAIEPTPAATQNVEVTLDGYVFVATIEGVQEDRAHNSRTGSASGHSRTTLQGAPYQPTRAYANPAPATAQQLALRELEFSDFALDWQLGIDWTVPAGAWSYAAETPISALTKIALAAGGMIQSAPDSDTIIIKPRAPAAPWAFASETPDFVLAGGSWFKKGRRYASGGRYNGAVVTGQQQGVNVILYRDGTGGSPYAQQIVDPLITDTAPAIARGTQIVADSLDRHEIPIELPLVPSPAAPGLLLPGELGEIEDTVWGTYRAVVDAVTISAEVSDEGLVTARQNATLWRYLP